MVFAIHWHESAMDLHVFPILNPPPASLHIPFLWAIPENQPWAMVSCIQPGLEICFTLDNIHVSMLFSRRKNFENYCLGYSILAFVYKYRWHLKHKLVCSFLGIYPGLIWNLMVKPTTPGWKLAGLIRKGTDSQCLSWVTTKRRVSTPVCQNLKHLHRIVKWVQSLIPYR